MIYEYFKDKNTVKNFYLYNLQNRVKEVRTFSALASGNPVTSVRFFYNGAGNRTRKVSEKEDRIYILDAGGGGVVFEAVKDDSDNYNVSDYYFYGKGNRDIFNVTSKK